MSERGGEVLGAMLELPGGRELSELAQAGREIALVGGATRDLLLHRRPRELDVVVAGDAAELARELSERIGGAAQVTEHDRFGTAVVRWREGRVDVARRRSERYPEAGALPEVGEGSETEDLLRRDFTVNAIAVTLGGEARGTLHGAPHALEDLRERRLRVTHARSFIEDPTRLLRLARYATRLGFEAERHTARLAAEAIAAGALSTVSPARTGAELRLALAEDDAAAVLATLERTGALSALHPGLGFDERQARRALELLPEDGRAELLLMSALLLDLARAAEEQPALLLDAMEFPAAERDRVARSALLAPQVLEALRAGGSPSHVRAALSAAPVEAVALAAAATRERPVADTARAWLGRWRLVRLRINGDDLLAAGVPAGPAVGRMLERALERKLDGEISGGPEEELRAALEEGA